MSLQGTLDTFSLPEILELVEKSRKTGALEVRDPQSRGVLYFAGGRFSAAEAGDLNGPVESAEELEARLIDVCFTLFRVETGLFEFESDRFPPWPVRGGSEVAPIVEQVQQLRRDWLAIEAVLPSLECRPDVVQDLDGDRVVLDKAGFRVLRVVDGDRNVREIARAAGRSVLEVCKVLKDLIEAGAVVVPADPARTMVDELVLTTDDAVEVAPVPEPAYPESHGEPGPVGPEPGGAEYTDLPEVPGLVVPSSPEGLTDVDFPDAAPPTAGDGDGDFRDYVAEAREAEHSDQASAAVEAFPEPAPDAAAYADEPAVAHGSAVGEPASRDPADGAAPNPDEAIDDEAIPDEAIDDDPDEPAPDRGALLRMFSSLRDT